ncbi:enhancer of mRNA-decapping protein 3 isoform X2 [Ctenocephalides felis]|uniref:enhancer of mRNA-decapping protein 3 isoform X2 n=1 Tax=Ctenocephalides felis TaxID=7515 RepID=UPI000E6E3E0A|nr:enhancer of mRNA-decapping protein 3 isoform X2 [Ctenocephalides felis]
MASWIGCLVSVNCGQTLGCYQGKISNASANQITLIKPFRNGMPYPQQEVTLCASDIIKLSIIDEQVDNRQNFNSNTVPSVKSTKKNLMSVSDALTSSHTEHENNKEQPKVKGVVINSLIVDVSNGGKSAKILTTKNNNSSSMKWDKKKTKEKNDECFGGLEDRNIEEDFDFEKNLALFDKQAIWDKINASKPDLLRQAGDNMYKSNEKKYRHDENVIATVPVSYRPISVLPEQQDNQPAKEYVTDDGLIIPSISTDTRDIIFRVANNVGLTHERNSELMGRAATEISLQLLGGGRRLNPSNSHQAPVIVAICGNGRSGSYTMNAARQLATHGVKTVVMKICSSLDTAMELEHSLYRLTGHKTVTRTSDLPRPDLILVGFSPGAMSLSSNMSIKTWINDIRVPVLAIDPPINGYEGFDSKYSILSVLPLSYTASNGKLYLCNLGLPELVFTKIGIKYKSPFGSKFVIPLHSNDYLC